MLRNWSHGNKQTISTGVPGAGSSTIRAVEAVSEKLGCTTETLRRWVKQAEIDEGKREGLSTDERQQMKELQREVKELRRANEILRTASAFFAQAELDRQLKK